MECTTKFNDFITEISLTDAQKSTLRKAYKELRSNLNSDPISKNIISTFLQGSYARHTGVRPINKDDKIDVDLIVVTQFDYKIVDPQQALNTFVPFLNKYYPGKYLIQGRSLGIDLENCSIDLVPTAVPTQTIQRFLKEAFDTDDYAENFFKADSVIDAIKKYANEETGWKNEPLKIPDREAGKWDDTHPVAQILWTQELNQKTRGNYIKMVRALKWWKKNYCKNAETIKSYPLEHFLGECCPITEVSLATLITLTLKKMASYSENLKPQLADHGVPYHDVFARVEFEDYKNFILQIRKIAKQAEIALLEKDFYESALKWRAIFGPKFPIYDHEPPKFTKREAPSTPDKPSRYA